MDKIKLKISYCILWKKGWYKHTGNDRNDVIKDLREMFKYDDFNWSMTSEEDIIHYIISEWERFVEWYNNLEGIYPIKPLTTICKGNYHNIYPNYGFELNMCLEILSYLAYNVDVKYLDLPTPTYSPNRYRIGSDHPGMTYADMNEYAKKVFEKYVPDKWHVGVNPS